MSGFVGRMYRALIALHPRAFREEYGRELLQTLEEREEERRRLPWMRRWRGRLREVSALLRSAASLRPKRRRGTGSGTARATESLNPLLLDLRFALRGFRTQPGFAAVIVITLGLGIGANSAIFTLLDQILLRRLPVSHPEELVHLDAPGPWSGWVMGRARFSHPFYRELAAEDGPFSGVLARYGDSVTLEHSGRSERIQAVLVSGNYFEVLGVRPHRGRLLRTADDLAPGAHPVAVLSHRFWRSRFGADPGVVGETLRVNGHGLEILGVAAEGFSGVSVGEDPDVFVPLMMKAQVTPTWNELEARRTRFLSLLARRKPGISLEQTTAAANVVFANLSERDLAEMTGVSETFIEEFRERRLVVTPAGSGISELRERFSTPLVVLMSMVGLVLLIACANVANLLLARSVARQREVALKLALGASRARLVRQLLVESCLLALAGGVFGLAVSSWTAQLLLQTLPFDGAAATFSADPDPRVLGFTFALASATGLLFGLVPALQSTSPAQARTLKEEGVAAAPPQTRFRKLLVVAQVALSLLLLVGAGLFVQSLYNLKRLDPGFRAEMLSTFSVDPSLNGYSQERMRAFFRELRREVEALPGVTSVSMAEIPTMGDAFWMSTVRVEGYEADEDEDMNPGVNAVGPGYFRTMGMPLLAGRGLTEADTLDAPKVAVINQTMARYFFGDRSPLGKRFAFGRRSEELDIEIVGVVADGKYRTLREELSRFVYIPYAQSEPLSAMTFYVRSATAGPGVVQQARSALGEIDPALPIYDVKSMEAQVAESLFLDRLVAGLSAAFGLVACLLAAVGLYGVMSFTVSRRTREIGIRMALGARRDAVMRLVLREVAALAVVGVLVGLPLGVVLGRVVESQLFQLSPWDPATWLGAAFTLFAVAFTSGYLPAHRASRLDPTRALRCE